MSFFKNLFKEAGVKDVITLFHAPKNPVSTRVYTLLKQTHATAVAHATEDQASDHDKQSKLERTEFELDVQEGAPTTNQLTSILEYLGPSKAGSVINGATGTTDALRKFKAGVRCVQIQGIALPLLTISYYGPQVDFLHATGRNNPSLSS